MQKNIQFLFGTLALFACLVSLLPRAEAAYVKKEYRNSFLSPQLQKSFYQIEVRTTKFLDRQQSNVNGLVESFRGTSAYSYDLLNRAFTYGKGGALDCHAFTYDDAVAIIAYTVAGKKQKAADILRVFRKEFYNVKNDKIGLYTSYRTDVPDNGGLAQGIDGDKIHFGPIVWIGIAALQYTALTGDLQYLAFAIDIAKWGQHQNHHVFPDGDRGGVCMGSGWGPDWSQIYSTENNIDYYAFLNMLKAIHEQGNDRCRRIFKRKSYDLKDIEREMHGIRRWMKEIAYNKTGKYYNCGFNEKGSDKTHALDTVTWTIAAFGPELLQKMGVDPFELMEFAERKFMVANNVGGEVVEGFDFTDTECRRRLLKMIWIEGTGQQIIAYQVMSRFAKQVGLSDKADEYRQKAIKFSDEMEKISRIARIIDHALPYTSKCPKEKEVMFTFAYDWEVPRGHKGQWVGSVSSTVWRYFALTGFNPLDFDTAEVTYRLLKTK